MPGSNKTDHEKATKNVITYEDLQDKHDVYQLLTLSNRRDMPNKDLDRKALNRLSVEDEQAAEKRFSLKIKIGLGDILGRIKDPYALKTVADICMKHIKDYGFDAKNLENTVYKLVQNHCHQLIKQAIQNPHDNGQPLDKLLALAVFLYENDIEKNSPCNDNMTLLEWDALCPLFNGTYIEYNKDKMEYEEKNLERSSKNSPLDAYFQKLGDAEKLPAAINITKSLRRLPYSLRKKYARTIDDWFSEKCAPAQTQPSAAPTHADNIQLAWHVMTNKESDLTEQYKKFIDELAKHRIQKQLDQIRSLSRNGLEYKFMCINLIAQINASSNSKPLTNYIITKTFGSAEKFYKALEQLEHKELKSNTPRYAQEWENLFSCRPDLLSKAFEDCLNKNSPYRKSRVWAVIQTMSNHPNNAVVQKYHSQGLKNISVEPNRALNFLQMSYNMFKVKMNNNNKPNNATSNENSQINTKQTQTPTVNTPFNRLNKVRTDLVHSAKNSSKLEASHVTDQIKWIVQQFNERYEKDTLNKQLAEFLHDGIFFKNQYLKVLEKEPVKMQEAANELSKIHDKDLRDQYVGIIYNNKSRYSNIIKNATDSFVSDLNNQVRLSSYLNQHHLVKTLNKYRDYNNTENGIKSVDAVQQAQDVLDNANNKTPENIAKAINNLIKAYTQGSQNACNKANSINQATLENYLQKLLTKGKWWQLWKKSAYQTSAYKQLSKSKEQLQAVKQQLDNLTLNQPRIAQPFLNKIRRELGEDMTATSQKTDEASLKGQEHAEAAQYIRAWKDSLSLSDKQNLEQQEQKKQQNAEQDNSDSVDIQYSSNQRTKVNNHSGYKKTMSFAPKPTGGDISNIQQLKEQINDFRDRVREASRTPQTRDTAALVDEFYNKTNELKKALKATDQGEKLITKLSLLDHYNSVIRKLEALYNKFDQPIKLKTSSAILQDLNKELAFEKCSYTVTERLNAIDDQLNSLKDDRITQEEIDPQLLQSAIEALKRYLKKQGKNTTKTDQEITMAEDIRECYNKLNKQQNLYYDQKEQLDEAYKQLTALHPQSNHKNTSDTSYADGLIKEQWAQRTDYNGPQEESVSKTPTLTGEAAGTNSNS